ncbi:MAG: glycosyltransferase, partial [Egibacteraceae bacterium]
GGSRTRAQLWCFFDDPPSKQRGSTFHDLLHCTAGYRRRHDFDIIHDHSGLIGPAIGAFADGPAVVHTLHGPWTPDSRSLYESLPPQLRLVAISQDQCARAPENLPIVGVVPNGIPLDRYPLRAERRGTDGYLFFIGRASREKGPDVAVRVAKRLGRKLRMVVKINEPPEEAYWRAAVEPHLDGADVEIIHTVSTQEKAVLMAGADACLFPIQWAEPFGLVMIEAMACGTPVIAFANGASPEVIVDGETGFLLPEGDLDGLCDAVTRVGDIDPRACRARVQDHFSSARMVEGYERIYEQVLTPVTAPGEDPAAGAARPA